MGSYAGDGDLGESAFGISQSVGNGWEWTSMVFQPFPGFQPFALSRILGSFLRRRRLCLEGSVLYGRTPDCYADSFRNWFVDFPYVYGGFRCARD